MHALIRGGLSARHRWAPSYHGLDCPHRVAHSSHWLHGCRNNSRIDEWANRTGALSRSRSLPAERNHVHPVAAADTRRTVSIRCSERSTSSPLQSSASAVARSPEPDDVDSARLPPRSAHSGASGPSHEGARDPSCTRGAGSAGEPRAIKPLIASPHHQSRGSKALDGARRVRPALIELMAL
jgi:hypothetical protein